MLEKIILATLQLLRGVMPNTDVTVTPESQFEPFLLVLDPALAPLLGSDRFN